jgi:hypothetical protein
MRKKLFSLAIPALFIAAVMVSCKKINRLPVKVMR